MSIQGRKRDILFLSLLLSAGLTLPGCLEKTGESEVPAENLNNSDFSVTNPDGGSSTGGGRPVPPPDSGSPTTPPQDQSNDDGGDVSTQLPAGFLINNGALITGSDNLNLLFNPPFTSAYYKASLTADCSAGNWLEYVSDSANLVSDKLNQAVTVSVQFRDHDGRVSLCFKNSIYVDKAGPQIVYQKYPTSSIEEGQDVELIFDVQDQAGVGEVQCAFAGITKACLAGTNKVLFAKMAGGRYEFNVVAKDRFGNQSQKAISFEVTSLYRTLKQSISVKENKKVDILFVVDNSGSMQYEQKSMASRVKNFLDVVQGLDWQAAVTTTDPSHSTYGDGRLVAMKGLSGTYILNSNMDPAISKSVLSNTLQRSETGSGSEQGIYATYRAIERGVMSTGVNRSFVRDGAQLAVVVISDEDESANGFKNDPTNLINYIQNSFGGQKGFSFHSIIARPGDKACLNGEGATAGYRLQKMAQLTGGLVGDVCATDYAVQMQGVAEGVRATLKTLTLSCEPIEDAFRKIHVLKDGQIYNGAYVKTGVNLMFTEMLPAGNYEVVYTCLK